MKSKPAVAGASQNQSLNTASDSCPECGSALVPGDNAGETVCESCSLVVGEDQIDHGPDWRNFGDEPSKSRVGAPRSELYHDSGLSTKISEANKDAYGNTISRENRRKMNRLRTWDTRFKTANSGERTLKQAASEIDRMGSALGLPETVRETAVVTFRRAHAEGLVGGRSLEAVASACLYTAVRMSRIPRLLRDVIHVSRAGKKDVGAAQRSLDRELGLELEPVNPQTHIPRFASECGLTSEHESLANELLSQTTMTTDGTGPQTLAAGALYAASIILGEIPRQRDLADAASMSIPPLRRAYRKLLGSSSRCDINQSVIHEQKAQEISKRLNPDGIVRLP